MPMNSRDLFDPDGRGLSAIEKEVLGEYRLTSNASGLIGKLKGADKGWVVVGAYSPTDVLDPRVVLLGDSHGASLLPGGFMDPALASLAGDDVLILGEGGRGTKWGPYSGEGGVKGPDNYIIVYLDAPKNHPYTTNSLRLQRRQIELARKAYGCTGRELSGVLAELNSVNAELSGLVGLRNNEFLLPGLMTGVRDSDYGLVVQAVGYVHLPGLGEGLRQQGIPYVSAIYTVSETLEVKHSR